MAQAEFDAKLEEARLTAAQTLPAACRDDFQRLSRTLVYGPAFQWLLVDAPNEALRKQAMVALNQVLRAARLRSNQLPLSDKIADVATLETRLLHHASQADVVHVVGRPGWFTAARWDAFNVRRERLATQCRARLVFWLDADAIALASGGAPDLWAWRGGVYSFAISDAAEPVFGASLPAGSSVSNLAPPPAAGIDNRTREEHLQRIAEIQAWLTTQPAPPDELLVGPVDELGNLLFRLRDYDAALAHWRTVAIPLHERLGNVREKAVTMGNIADIMQQRGQLDEALRIHQDEQLPVYERLGDTREKAVTMVKIADILRTRGQFEKALRILSEEVRPVFERLGNVREKAVTIGKIASILQARGQLDEALRIRQEEELPIYEHLGDVREMAGAMSQIADILQDRGQLDEALRIRQEELLPVFEHLGDARSKAVTMGKIADILQTRGQLNEALRIRQEDQLPVYERLGEAREQLICQTNVALLYAQRGLAADRPKIEALLRDAHSAAHAMQLPEAEQIALIYQRIVGMDLNA